MPRHSPVSRTVRWRFWYQLVKAKNGCCCGATGAARSRFANSKAAAKLRESTFDYVFHELLCATRWRRARDSSPRGIIRMNIFISVSDKVYHYFRGKHCTFNGTSTFIANHFKFLFTKRAIFVNLIFSADARLVVHELFHMRYCKRLNMND